MKKTLLLLTFNLLTILCFSQRISNKSYDTTSDTYWFEKSMDDIPDNYHFYLEYENYYDYFFDTSIYNNGSSWRGRGYDSFSEFKTKFSAKSGIYKYVDWKVFKAVDFMIYYTDSVVSYYSDSIYHLAIDTATVLSQLAQDTAIDSAKIFSNEALLSAVDSAQQYADLAQQTAIDSAKIFSNEALLSAVDSAQQYADLAQQTAIDSAKIFSNEALLSAVDSAQQYADLAQQTAIDSAKIFSNEALLSAVDSAQQYADLAQQTAIDSATLKVSQLSSEVNDSLTSLTTELKEYTDSKADGLTSVDGKIGIGMTPTYELDVNGVARAQKIIVEANGETADFVFAENYKLKDLSEVEKYVKTNKHLEDVPSADEMEKEGVNLAHMNKLLLQKVEELTLYLVEKDKEIKDLKLQQQQILDKLK